MRTKNLILLIIVLLCGALFIHQRQPAHSNASESIATNQTVDPAQKSPATDSTAPVIPTATPHTTSTPTAANAVTTVTDKLLSTIPDGPFRESLMVIGGPARHQALAKLIQLNPPKEDYASLRADPRGDLYYVCNLTPEAAQTAQAPTDETTAAAAPTTGEAAVPIATPPVRHSRPGSTKVLYLDFNGHTITGTAWNSTVTTYNALPLDTDGDPTTFSDAEQAVIIQVWERVAEDYAPFDVDVTTEEPATFTSTTGRTVITKNVDANGANMPSSTAGGVAYLSVFGSPSYSTYYSPALVYFNNVGGGTNAGLLTEAISHELGHNLGLSHDGTTSGSTYYGGHGTGETSWGPIMGTGYNRNVSQWCKGEYYLANNTQDDLSIIGTKLPLIPDDVGNTTATAVTLPVSSGSFSTTGLFNSATDTDLYVVTLPAGTTLFSVAGYRSASGTHGGNIDVKLDLLDSTGTVLFSNDLLDSTRTALSYTVTAGDYYLRLTPVAAGSPLTASPTGYTTYGTIGQYTLTGASVTPSVPTFTTQPATQTVYATTSVNFNVVATGAPTPTLQWRLNGTDIPGATSTRYTIASTASTDAGAYTVSATNSQGTTTSSTANLTVNPVIAPSITTQPVSLTVTAGASATFTVVATGTPTPTYQWKLNGTAISGATNATYTIAATTTASAGSYTVTVTNNGGTLTSSAATLTVNNAPTITTQPVSQTIIAGNSATFTVVATGTPTPTYQWKFNGTAISGATNSTYTIPATTSANAGAYTVTITNSVGNVTSSAATLTVNPTGSPTITTQPISQTVFIGYSATLTVIATGAPTLTYQWKRNGTALTGATNSTYTITNATNTDAGPYTVTITNGLGNVTSSAANVTVTAAVAPAITSPNQAGAAIDEPFSYVITANNSPSSFATTGLPAGLTLNTATGAITGSPTTAGTFTVSLNATNTVGTGTATLTLLVLPATTITTLAGQLGTSGSTDATDTAARFNYPSNIIADTAGVLYVTDSSNHTVRKIALSGAVTTLAGLAGTSGSTDGTGSGARFNTPAGIAIDSVGNLYVADTNNHTLRKITALGVVTTVAGSAGSSGTTNGTGSLARFNHPAGLVIDSVGALYLADSDNHAIRKTIFNGTAVTVSTFAGQTGVAGSSDGTGASATFNTPLDLAIDSTGTLYVADTGNHTLRKITSSLTVSTVAGQAGTLGSADGIGTAARLKGPAGLALDRGGNLYIADSSHTLRRFTLSTGQVITLAGFAGTPGTADGSGNKARFNLSTGLAIDANNYIYIADTDNHAIRAVSSAPVITTQPLSATVATGSNANLSVTAISHPTPTYQWYKDAVAVSGATAATLSLTNVQTTHAGSYTVTVSNNMGNVTSTAATLTVNQSGPSSPSSSSSSSGSSGGGGGSPSGWFVSALATLCLVRRFAPKK